MSCSTRCACWPDHASLSDLSVRRPSAFGPAGWVHGTRHHGNHWLVEAVAIRELLKTGLRSHDRYAVLGGQRSAAARLSADLINRRIPRLARARDRTIDGRRTSLLDRTLGAIGIPPWDILAGRAGLVHRFYEFRGERDDVLGPLLSH